ncbi:translation initiation factor eIF-3b [Exidia glandulosa HHB12029]|uniref:Eukaryotic translation initiation factor 3 subunit B n=1 Tax=Exidia glandulosa HHB12029 TaxID=1314781 RepID=A0A165IZH7_EXIGL|nr:translation initiation factor eIF-3b [Exidia glandulosa HHB12029]
MPAPVTNGIHANDDDIDYSDIEAKYQVHLNEGYDNVVVVDGVPLIDHSKEEKLYAKIGKEFARKGCPFRPENLYMPWDSSTNKSKGYLFIEFPSDDEATLAIAHMDHFAFDPKHTFRVNRFTDIEKYANMDAAFAPPEPEPFKPREHLRAWLADNQGRDQYVTYRQDDVAVMWHGKPAQVANEKKNWTDLYVAWSPLGTLMVTMHRQGIQLWGGPSWERLMRFAHPMAKLVDFSPCEQYLVTWSHDDIHVHDGMPQGPQYFSPEDEGNNLAVWDVRTGHLLRTFKTQNAASDNEKQQMPWPQLKWSPDDKFVARVTPDVQISVYELPSMGLNAKKSIKIDGVVDFEWRPLGDKDREEEGKSKKPRENMIAFWTPEVANQPARVSLMAFPSRSVLRAKNLFNVTECKLHFQNQGDFLCVKVDRHTKTKKSIFCNLEIFRIREKDFPVEVVELKDTVLDFSWEPNGERFAIVSTSDPNYLNPGPGVTLRTDVSFYQLERGKDNFKLLRNLPARSTNTIRWSPKGRHIVLATVGSSSKSELEFWDLDFNNDDYGRPKDPGTSKDEWGSGIQLLGTGDHYGVTDVEWDPSGRFVATSASVWKHMLENGFCIWDFRGQELEKHILDRFKQFLWRPRPRTLLTKEQQRLVRKNLREYSRAFDEEDAAEESNVSAELLALRKRLVDEWNAWRAQVKREARGQKEEEATEEISEWIEEIIEQTEEVVE